MERIQTYVGHAKVSDDRPLDRVSWERAEREARAMARRKGARVTELRRIDDGPGMRVVRVVGKVLDASTPADTPIE